MRKSQEDQLKQLRRKLGDALRRSDDVVSPIKSSLIEQGYRWDPEDVLQVMLAVDDLKDDASDVFVSLVDFVNTYYKSLTEVELEWLAGTRAGKGGAVGRLREGLKILDSIDGKKLIALEDAFFEKGTDVSKGHEAYFLQRYGVGARLLRKAWVFLFYAVSRPKRPRRVKLTAAETRGWYNPLSPGVRDKVIEQAQEAASESGVFVEVYADDGELIYVGLPPDTLREAEMKTARRGEKGLVKPRVTWEYRRRQPTPGVKLAADVTPEQAAAVRVLMLEQPGIGLRDAADQVGIEVVAAESLTPNRGRRYSDAAMLYELFGTDF